ncbi:MAG TPA: ABC transporter permease [Verrucomicrobiae bacterium]|nr:ABC transporter permease [Verrucomicrobiae bacterium]
MPFWPVAAREARAAARAPRTFAWRIGVTAIGIATLPISLSTDSPTVGPGRATFTAVSMLAFLYCAFGGVLRTADVIAEEKRENTLGLLFLTDLKAPDIIIGKLLASSASLFFGLLALMPLLAIPFLIGGVTSRQMLFMILCLVNSLFFAISCGFLISTIFRQGWVTISAGLAAMLFYCALIPLVSDRLDSIIAPDSIDVVSPTNFFVNVVDNAPPNQIWLSFAVTHLLAWLHIFLTAKYLPVLWQERPRSRRGQLWWERLRRLRFGGANTRTRFRTRLLNKNPLFWLSGREQVSSSGLMTLLMIIASLSLVSGWKEVFVGLVLMHGMLLIRMSSAASHSFAEDRKSGALELLLATSLSVGDVLRGRWLALGRQFFGPILIVGIWHLFAVLWVRVMSDVYETTMPLMTALPALVMAWVATGACGMWMGLRARHPVAAMWGTLFFVVLAPWMILTTLYSVLLFFQMLPELRFQSRTPFVTMGLFLWGVYLAALRAIIIRQVRARFREAATDRYSDTQPIDWRPFWRITWKVGAATALLILSIWGIRAWINISGERALQKTLAKHPEFQLSEPPRPFIPPEKNLAHTQLLAPINGALNVVNRSGQKTNLQSLFFTPFNERAPLENWRFGKTHPVLAPEQNAALELRFKSEIASLHAAAAERPYFFISRPRDPAYAGNFYSLQNWVTFLATRAEIRVGRNERPVDDILLALRFANAITNEVEAMRTRAHNAALVAVIQPIYDGIHSGVWRDADLQAFQKSFEQIDTFRHYEEWQHYIVRTVATALTNPPTMNNPNMYGSIIPFYWGTTERRSKLPGRLKAQQSDLVRIGLDDYKPIVNSSRGMIDLTPWRGGQRFGSIETYWDVLAQHMEYHLRTGAATLAVTHTTIQLAATACAIERYRLAHGKLPDSLQQLAPTYAAKVPLDVVTGQPLIYKLTSDGYLLYSISLDGVDHGGRPEKPEVKAKPGVKQQKAEAGDWVWIYKK